MNASKKALLILLTLVGLVFIYLRLNRCECKARVSYSGINLNQGINLDSLYRPVDSFECKEIYDAWKEFDLSSDSFEIVREIKYTPVRKLLIVVHYHKGEKHFGAIILPEEYDEKNQYPLLVWANGLDQRNPAVDLKNGIIRTLIRNLPQHFIVIPSYRGQALVAYGKRYCSDGFFGDAFDGATDDALRLLALTRSEFSGIDAGQIAVCGLSRGGTVALLMAARDSTIAKAVSIAAPTNFLSEEFYRRYGIQYKYQFLSRTKSLPEIRSKVLKSSPLYFIENYPGRLLLIHGINDRIVPVENANAIISKLKGRIILSLSSMIISMNIMIGMELWNG